MNPVKAFIFAMMVGQIVCFKLELGTSTSINGSSQKKRTWETEFDEEPIVNNAKNEYITEVSPMGITEASPMGITEASPMGITEASPMGITEASPMGITEASPMGITEASPMEKTSPKPDNDALTNIENNIGNDMMTEPEPMEMTSPKTYTDILSDIENYIWNDRMTKPAPAFPEKIKLDIVLKDNEVEENTLIKPDYLGEPLYEHLLLNSVFPGVSVSGIIFHECDSFGMCYNASVNCTDNKMTVSVTTNKPFNGRVQALGKSQTCSTDVKDSMHFQLDLSLTADDCNTQSNGDVHSNILVIQHNSVLISRKDLWLHLQCKYNLKSKDTVTTSAPPPTPRITSAPAAPAPKIVILGPQGNEVKTTRIGEKMTFVIEMPEDTLYGFSAQRCYASAIDGEDILEIIDENGCTTDSEIFPTFLQQGNSLEAIFYAFRFTGSHRVLFKCNIKYCLGQCPPVNCKNDSNVEKTYRQKRSELKKAEFDVTLSYELQILDNGENQAQFQVSNTSNAVPLNAEFLGFQSLRLENIITCYPKSLMEALIISCVVLLTILLCSIGFSMARR